MSGLLAFIVEGQGEVATIRPLIQRLAAEEGLQPPDMPKPFRCPRSKIIRGHQVDRPELERAIRFTVAQLPSPDQGALLILLDADDACPAQIGQRIAALVETISPRLQFGVVLAKWEFEAWFAAGIESLRGLRGIREDAVPPANSEQLRDPKGYLKSQMIEGRSYSETADMPALAARLNLQSSTCCRSFQKFRKEVRRLLSSLQ